MQNNKKKFYSVINCISTVYFLDLYKFQKIRFMCIRLQDHCQIKFCKNFSLLMSKFEFSNFLNLYIFSNFKIHTFNHIQQTIYKCCYYSNKIFVFEFFRSCNFFKDLRKFIIFNNAIIQTKYSCSYSSKLMKFRKIQQN